MPEPAKKNRTAFVQHTRSALKELAENLNFTSWEAANTFNTYFNQHVLSNPEFKNSVLLAAFLQAMNTLKDVEEGSEMAAMGYKKYFTVDLNDFKYRFTMKADNKNFDKEEADNFEIILNGFNPKTQQLENGLYKLSFKTSGVGITGDGALRVRSSTNGNPGVREEDIKLPFAATTNQYTMLLRFRMDESQPTTKTFVSVLDCGYKGGEDTKQGFYVRYYPESEQFGFLCNNGAKSINFDSPTNDTCRTLRETWVEMAVSMDRGTMRMGVKAPGMESFVWGSGSFSFAEGQNIRWVLSGLRRHFQRHISRAWFGPDDGVLGARAFHRGSGGGVRNGGFSGIGFSQSVRTDRWRRLRRRCVLRRDDRHGD